MHKLPQPHPWNLGLSPLLPPVLLGFAASSFQVYLIREFSVHFYGNEMTYGLVLGAWLLWGGLGSLLASRQRIAAWLFTPVLLGAVAVFPLCLAALRLSRFALHLLPGEITGLSLMLPFALGLGLLINFPLGMLFVLAVRADQGNISRVWVGESLGATLAGLAVSLVLVPRLSNWQGVVIVGAAVCGMTLALPRTRSRFIILAAALLILTGLWLFDTPSQRIYWRPFEFLAGRDTPYGKLQVIRLKEQVSLYSDGLPVYASGETSAAEESIHFAFLQNPGARRALLIGGAAGGGLAEALKYPGVSPDYVELDPEIVRLSLRYLPPKQKGTLEDKRVHIYFEDGRTFLEKFRGAYDCIVLELPEPANAQINRFYTREFFELAKSRLEPGGIVSFRVPSAEDYISPERQQFLSTLDRTLRAVFSQVEVVPGEANIFLASEASLTLDVEELNARRERLGVETIYVRPELLTSRLNRLRISSLKDRLAGGKAGVNSDLEPLSYYFDTVLWNAQFRSAESRFLSGLARVPKAWLLAVPVVLALMILLLVPGHKPGFALVPLVFLGFTQIVAEVMLLLWFQTLHGSVYGRLALLLAMFMGGLCLGAVVGSRKGIVPRSRLLWIQSGILAWLLAVFFLLRVRLPEFFFYLMLIGLGFLGGHFFITANRLFLEKKQDYGLGNSLDLLGSFLGAIAAASVFIPLAGLPGLAICLVVLNAMSVLAVGTKLRPG